jgi:hypothetical protein
MYKLSNIPIMYFLMRMGAFLPGMRAVVMTMSTSLHQGWQLKTHPKKPTQKNPPKKEVN